VKTDIQEDLNYLEELLAANPKYFKHQPEKEYEMYMGSWEMVEPDILYIKIDDDVVR
jgi:hypothetical protein